MFSTNPTQNGSRGFTLIELLVVIAIISMLSSVIMASLNGARIKARDSKRVQDIRQLQLAITLFYDDFRRYPNSLTELTPDYIPVVPDPPPGTAAYRYARYGGVGAGTNYHLGAELEEEVTIPDRDCRSDSTTNACISGQTASTGGFNGQRLTCTNGVNQADYCYDVTP